MVVTSPSLRLNTAARSPAPRPRLTWPLRTFLEQPNLRGLGWWQTTVPQVLPFLDASQSELIQTVLQEQSSFADSDTYRSLPQGPAHCDLFRDNVLFAGTSGSAPDGRHHRLLLCRLRHLAV